MNRSSVWCAPLYSRAEISGARAAVSSVAGYVHVHALQTIDIYPYGEHVTINWRALASWDRYPLAGNYRPIR